MDVGIRNTQRPIFQYYCSHVTHKGKRVKWDFQNRTRIIGSRKRLLWSTLLHILQDEIIFYKNDKKYITFNNRGYSFVGNIYTYFHILSRHHFPIINSYLNVTMNDNNNIINPNYLLEDIKKLINKYYSVVNSLNEKNRDLTFQNLTRNTFYE